MQKKVKRLKNLCTNRNGVCFLSFPVIWQGRCHRNKVHPSYLPEQQGNSLKLKMTVGDTSVDEIFAKA